MLHMVYRYLYRNGNLVVNFCYFRHKLMDVLYTLSFLFSFSPPLDFPGMGTLAQLEKKIGPT